MNQPWRLPRGGRIDRTRPIEFRFDDRVMQGHDGDTLASALLANGVHRVGRSFKYHRPRGIVAAGSEEPNALVTLRAGDGRDDPNTRATQVRLRSGLEAHSQNRWPNLAFDLGAFNSLLSPLWSAGFYYKTFMWPRSAWKSLYEPFIRSAAGLGRAPQGADPDTYSTRFGHCDVLIVGAGPAGLAAALTASASGARVMVCDEQWELGGELLSRTSGEIEGRDVADWLASTVAALASRDNVNLLPATTAFGYYVDNLLGLVQHLDASPCGRLPRQRLWQVRAREVVLATGAIERPLVFPGNDRPGVLLASAARTYANRYAVQVGDALVVYVAENSGYEAALEIQQTTRCVRAIIDPRREPPSQWLQAATEAGIETFSGHAVVGTTGRSRVRSVRIVQLSAPGPSRERSIACDAVLMAGGWTPTVHLFSQTRSPLEWDEGAQSFIPGEARQRTHVAGACRGLTSLAETVADGANVGAVAARAADSAHGTPRPQRSARARACSVEDVGALHEIALRGKAFVDFQNDVCARDIAQAVREGFHSVEHLKRYTTTGMATDQGKTSNINAMALAGRLLETPPKLLGTTTFRAPYTPVSFGALAGEHRGLQLDPVRLTPMHDWAMESGAVFEPVALWQRARYFPRAGESMHQAVDHECAQTRKCAGIFDASTLGKIEVVGPDAVAFLDRMYPNSWGSLQVGRCRYGLMLREDGYVFDDGVVGRLATDRFHVTTTSGGAARVLHHMEDYLQTEFHHLRVWLTSVTEEWAVIAVNGPRSRAILQPLVEGIDLDASAFPHMSVRVGRICGAPTRLFRVSFTGELGYEVNVPASHGAAVWEAIQQSGEMHGAVTYGTETMHVLRAEKGYIIVGQETDGTVTPQDLGLDWTIGRNKPDFVGQRSLARSGLMRADRPQLVGLLSRDGHTLIEPGAQILAPESRVSAGHVTSSYSSATVGRPIALALLASGRQRIGSVVRVAMPNGDIEAEVVSPLFYDPDGERLHV